MEPTFEGFKEFVKSKGDEQFFAASPFKCAFAQYLQSLGHVAPEVIWDRYKVQSDNFKPYVMLPAGIEMAIKETAQATQGQQLPTFSQLYARLEAV